MLDTVPSILIVSWNRRDYFERMIANLLADPSDYRLYFWDNGSADGVAELIASLDDPRIADRHLNPENVGQFDAWNWFLNTAKGDIGGKLDDDIIGRPGWMTRLAGMLAAEPRFGGLGGWILLPEDWNEAVGAHKIRTVGDYRIFENTWVAGCMFLARVDTLRKYTPQKVRPGVPVQWSRMRRDGLINGFPLPLELGENLDDPRHPDCRMNKPGGWDKYAAYTARRIGMDSPKAYGEWIAADARAILTDSIEAQLRRFAPTPMQKAGKRIERALAKLGLPNRSR
jgi:glycosyltransferase involved in cell wall biosynthesis